MQYVLVSQHFVSASGSKMRFWADRFSVRQVPKCAAANSTFIAITAKVLLLAATIQGNNCYPPAVATVAKI